MGDSKALNSSDLPPHPRSLSHPPGGAEGGWRASRRWRCRPGATRGCRSAGTPPRLGHGPPIQEPHRAGDPRPGDHRRGGGLPDLRRFRRRAARDVPGDRRGLRAHARRGDRPPPPPDRALSPALRRAHSAGTARGRQGLRAPPGAVDGLAPRPRRRPPPGRGDGARGQALLPPRRPPVDRRRRQEAPRRPGRRGEPARVARRRALGDEAHARRARRGGGDAAPALRAAGRATRARRPDGRLGLDAGAALRRRLRHPRQPRRAPRRPGRLPGRRDQHGVRRGALRRRRPDRPRAPLDPRRGLRPDDRPRRSRPHAALPAARLPPPGWAPSSRSG